MLEEVSPKMASSRQMVALWKKDPQSYMKQAAAFLEDRLVSAKNPELSLGLQSRELKKLPTNTVEPTGGIKPGMSADEQFAVMQKAHDTNIKAYQDWQSGKITKSEYGKIVNANQPKPLSVEPVGGSPLVAPREKLQTNNTIKEFEQIAKKYKSFEDFNNALGENFAKAVRGKKAEIDVDKFLGENGLDIQGTSLEDFDAVLKSFYNQAKSSPLGGKPVAQGGLSDVKPSPVEKYKAQLLSTADSSLPQTDTPILADTQKPNLKRRNNGCS